MAMPSSLMVNSSKACSMHKQLSRLPSVPAAPQASRIAAMREQSRGCHAGSSTSIAGDAEAEREVPAPHSLCRPRWIHQPRQHVRLCLCLLPAHTAANDDLNPVLTTQAASTHMAQLV